MAQKKTPKIYGKEKVEYFCKKCDFLTSNKKDYTRHLKTKKHSEGKKNPKKRHFVDFECILCKKKYKYKSSLYKHNLKCKYKPEKTVEKVAPVPKTPKVKTQKIFEKSQKNEKKEEEISLKEILMAQLKQQNETIELLKQSIETNSKMMPKIGNNNNNTISINLFLNERCKNAMNLTDFINQMQVSLEDLQYSKNNGFIEGVTNIFTKQLQDLKPTERPIHCSDKKRLQFYVKEDNKWAKDQNNEKIDETIYNIKMKQTLTLTEWEKKHPNYASDPNLLNEWQQMLNCMTEDIDNPSKSKDKLKRNIAQHIQIKEALTKSK